MARQYLGAVEVKTTTHVRNDKGRFTGDKVESTDVRNIEVHAKTEREAKQTVAEVAEALWPNAESIVLLDAARIKRGGSTVRKIPIDPSGNLYLPPAPENKSDVKLGNIVPFVSKIVGVEVGDKVKAKPATKTTKRGCASAFSWGEVKVTDEAQPFKPHIICGLAERGTILMYDKNGVPSYVTEEEQIK